MADRMASRRRAGWPCSNRGLRRVRRRIATSSGAGRRWPAPSMRAARPRRPRLRSPRTAACESSDLERLTTEKGAWLAFRGTERGAATLTLLAGIVDAGDRRAADCANACAGGRARAEFVRPVHGVVLLYGDDVVPVEVLGLAVRPHRRAGIAFMRRARLRSSQRASLREADSRRAKVIADFATRRDVVRAGVTRGGRGEPEARH